MSSCWNHEAVEPKDKDFPPLAADLISMVTAGTDSYDSASLKHFLQELSSPKSQYSMQRKHPGLPRAASQHSQLSGTFRPWWVQRTHVRLLPSTEMPFMGDSWGCPVATISPKPAHETSGVQIPPQSSDGTATGPASHLVPTQITTWLHSQLAALVQRQKSWLLNSTGGFPLRRKINLSVAPRGRRKLLVGATLEKEPSR